MIHTGTYYLFVTLYHVVCLSTGCGRTTRTNQFDQKILPQDKYFSKKVLFGLSEGTALLNNCFGPYTQYRMITIFQEKKNSGKNGYKRLNTVR